jgi:hypothetical protein
VHRDDVDAQPYLAPVADTPGEQDLLWGDWGGVALVAAILLTVVVMLTLTVGALPL